MNAAPHDFQKLCGLCMSTERGFTDRCTCGTMETEVMDMDCGKVGALIRKLRLEQGMTQRQLAEKLNLSDKAVSKWERGGSLR